MRPGAAWLSVLATLCLLLSTVHLGAIAGHKPHGFGHWPDVSGLFQQAPDEDGPEAGLHDDQPAKKRRAGTQVVSRQAEPAPASLPAIFIDSILPSPPRVLGTVEASLHDPDRAPAKPAPARQRHRGQAPPAASLLIRTT